MKTVNFTSSLAHEMAHFVKLKQLSGSDYHSGAKLLQRFDRHLVSLAFKGRILTREIVQSHFDTINHLCGRGFSNHYSVLRQFSEWLTQNETNSYILEKHSPPDRTYSRSAYIFSLDEIKAILVSSCDFTQREELVHGLYKTLFSLLYTTGIRIGEALALNYSDYIKEEKLIHIRKGKFRKERYLVLSQSAAKQLNRYLVNYKSLLPLEEESPLFVSTSRKRLIYNSARCAFLKILNKLGIIKKDSGPKLHSFRHTFAVHRLLQWYKTEEDINAKLPFLSTYMGHVNITSTQVYLEASAELLQPGNERFYLYFKNHIK